MTNRVTILGTLVDDPKIRTIEAKGRHHRNRLALDRSVKAANAPTASPSRSIDRRPQSPPKRCAPASSPK
jgi:single-stranded DNA-binding protein